MRQAAASLGTNEDSQMHIDSSSIQMSQIGALDQSSNLLIYDGTVNGASTRILVDCGATSNVVSKQFVDRHGFSTVESDHGVDAIAYDGSRQRSTHLLRNARLWIKDFKDRVTFKILDMPEFEVILGKPWLDARNPQIDWPKSRMTICRGHRITTLVPLDVQCAGQSGNSEGMPELISVLQLKRALRKSSGKPFGLALVQTVPEYNKLDMELTKQRVTPELKRLLLEYKTVFPDDLPPGLPPPDRPQHHIELISGAKPVSKPIYRLAQAESDELKRQITYMLDHGLIQPSSSPWGAPVFFRPKKDGTFRLCVDYRGLNAVTQKCGYTLPRIDDLVDRVHKARVFTKLDLWHGYHQMRIAPEDVPKTAIRTRYGHFEYKVVTFGFTNAPATFQKFMNELFAAQLDDYVVIYLDDILIYSEDMQTHLKHVRQVLQTLHDNQLYAKPSKCEFGKTEIDYVGFLVSNGTIRPNPAKIKTLVEWPVPKTQTEVRAFLGLCNYYRNFVDRYAQITKPLTDLTKGATMGPWTEQCNQAFNLIKRKLSSSPVLRLPDPRLPFTMETDASDSQVGAVLHQQDTKSGRNYIVSCFSKKLSQAQLHYPVHEKELLAIRLAFEKWRPYILGKHTIVYTDHESLKYFKSQPGPLSKRMARWSEYMEQFDYEIQYRPGKLNIVADALSRVQIAHLRESCPIPVETDVIIQGLHHDMDCKNVIDRLENKDAEIIKQGYKLRKGLLYKSNQVYVPNHNDLRVQIMRQCHDSIQAGHRGIKKTIMLLERTFYWPTLRHDAKQYVQGCADCQRNKPRNQAPSGLLKSLPVPSARWESISMDFITDLPMSDEKNCIVTVVDRLTKMAHFIPTTTTCSAPVVADLFLKNIFRLHGLPRSIISDRDTRFTGGFWKELMRLLDIKLKMSTAFHPQTDGQTERTNRILEEILRNYVNYAQSNWTEKLHLVEFAYNNSDQDSIGCSPFFLNYGFHPHTSISLLDVKDAESHVEAASDFAKFMSETLQHAMQQIKTAQTKQADMANKHRSSDPAYNLGDLVMLSSNNLSLSNLGTSGARKLGPKWIGPFKIIQVLSPVTYKLDLPDSWRIHSVFHSSILKPFHSPTFTSQHVRPQPVLVAGEQEWEVEDILAHRTKNRKRQYLVKWKGFPVHESTWESSASLVHSQSILQSYLSSHSGSQDT